MFWRRIIIKRMECLNCCDKCGSSAIKNAWKIKELFLQADAKVIMASVFVLIENELSVVTMVTIQITLVI